MLPKVILYNTVSLDGRMDFVSPDLGMFYGLVSVWEEDCTLVGSNTFLKGAVDEGLQPDKGGEGKIKDGKEGLPLLVLVDSQGRFNYWSTFAFQGFWSKPIVLCSERTSKAHLEYLQRVGVEYIVAGDEKVDLSQALEELANRGIRTIRVDSGGRLNGALLRAGLVDEVAVLVEPCAIGGSSPSSIYVAEDLNTAEGVLDLELIESKEMEKGRVWLRYRVKKG